MAVAERAVQRPEVPRQISEFLLSRTDDAWLDAAEAQLDALLLDHANCELKAASTAMTFLYRYPDRVELAQRMSRLAREELRHFEQVRTIMAEEGVPFEKLSASRYAGELRDAVRQQEPQKLMDMLIVGALIEARSCERFARLVPRLPARIGRFYAGLLASEARHFEHYLQFARTESEIPDTEFSARVEELRQLEAELIAKPDEQFRFHSGVPA